MSEGEFGWPPAGETVRKGAPDSPESRARNRGAYEQSGRAPLADRQFLVSITECGPRRLSRAYFAQKKTSRWLRLLVWVFAAIDK